jgi:hypothetical protein
MEPGQVIVATEAVKVLAPEVYKDGLQPAVQELGKGVHTITKLVTMALAPISAMVWGYDKIKTYLVSALEERLNSIPEHRIISPDPVVAGPAIEALRFAGHKEELRKLYANLLASSMDSETAHKAHPAFVEILKQLTPDEARLLTYMSPNTSYPVIQIRANKTNDIAFGIALSEFTLLPYQSNCEYPLLGPNYIINFSRLGLIDLSYSTYVINPSDAYVGINNHPYVQQACEYIRVSARVPDIRQGSINFTELGKQFYDACIR